MNKIKKSITTILCAVLMLMGFTACGKTAYDVAVRNGYRGTEEEWLLTLQGSDGKDGSDLSAKELYEEAVAEAKAYEEHRAQTKANQESQADAKPKRTFKQEPAKTTQSEEPDSKTESGRFLVTGDNASN